MTTNVGSMPTIQVGGVTTQDAANQAAVGSAVVGTAIGAVAGAAIGGSQGAAVGAGVGLVGGSAVGANSAYASGYGTQRQYNNAYIQCMYVKGHAVPVPANMAYPQRMVSPANTGPVFRRRHRARRRHRHPSRR